MKVAAELPGEGNGEAVIHLWLGGSKLTFEKQDIAWLHRGLVNGNDNLSLV